MLKKKLPMDNNVLYQQSSSGIAILFVLHSPDNRLISATIKHNEEHKIKPSYAMILGEYPVCSQVSPPVVFYLYM